MRQMEHHPAKHAGDEVGGVVGLTGAVDDDALEVLRAVAAGQAEIGFHGGKYWMDVQYFR